MNLNLFFAIFWMLLAVGLILWGYIDPLGKAPMIRGTNIPAGWLVMALAVWNLLRWWSTYVSEQSNRRYEEQMAFQRQQRHYHEPERPREKDPNFDFGNSATPQPAPPPEPPKPSSGEPPPANQGN